MAGNTKTQQEEALANLLTQVGTLNEGVEKMTTTIEQFKKIGEAFKDVDPAEVIKRVEKAEAGLARVRESIRTNRSGIFLPGLEDEGESKKFSLLRAVLVAKMPSLRQNKAYGYEVEVLKAAREKAQSAGVPSDGGFFIPDQVIPDVIQAIYTRSVMISLAGEGTTRVSVIDGLTGSPVKIPKFEGGALAYWIGEEDKYVASKAGVGQVNLMPRKLGVLLEITDEMRKFQAYGFEQLLRNDMVRAAAKKLDWSVIYGQGTDNAPRGITNINGITMFSVESGAVVSASPADSQGAEASFDTLDEMMGALEDQNLDIDDSFAFVSSPRFFRKLRQLKMSQFSGQTTERGYLLGKPILPDTELRAVIGEFDKTTQIPTTNLPGESLGWDTTSTDEKFTDIVGANWNDVLVGRWSGVEIDEGQSDDDFVKDKSKVKLRLYADVGHRQEKAIVFAPDAKVRA